MPLYSSDPYLTEQEPQYLENPAYFDFNVDPLPPELQDFVIGEEEAGEPENLPADDEVFDFYENLAEKLDDTTLDTLANRLLEEIKDDRASRRDLERAWELGVKYLGWKVEEFSNIPFARSSAAFDDTMSIAVLNALALIMNELFPPGGPVKGEVEGIPTQEMDDRADRVKMFMNLFLTKIDQPYYANSYKMILYTVIFGSAFRKVVMDPILKRPSPRFVAPQNLIINNESSSLLESSRITHELPLTKKEILIRQRDGIYRRDTIPDTDESDDDDSSVDKTIKNSEGIKDSQLDKSSSFKFYESHVDLDPLDVKDNLYEEGDDSINIPRPYIVEICGTTSKIASIRRNWDQNDNNFRRKECFVPYTYTPGLGLYGVGLAQLMGSNAIALTDILRQQIDAGTLKNFPGGLIQKGFRIEQNNKAIGPSEFLQIDTGGAPLRDALMLMPYNEPSSVLAQLRNDLKNDTLSSAGAAQQISQMATGNTSEGTILAQIEVQNRVPSVVLRSLHDSLGYELRLLKALFAENFTGPYPFNVPGNSYTITKEDFSDNINTIPVSDPNIVSTRQRVIISELVVRMAKEEPGLIDKREAYRMLFESLKIDNIKKLMPEPQEIMPLDPVSENMNMINGKGAKASIEQNHEAHIMAHSQIAQMIGQDQAKMALLQAHLSEHQALMYLVQIQQMMGMQMPDAQMLQNPEVQNQIAMMAAKAAQEAQQQQQAQNPPPLDPNMVMLKDIEQRREESLLKHEDAQLKAETEAYKAQTKFESDKLKMEVERELAKDKNEVSLEIASMKQPNKSE
jgi:hypothetical protein